MLVEFSVANFRSIKDKITLSMQATSLRDKPENKFTENGMEFLRTAVVYGPNASGKSNLFKAFNTFIRFIMNPGEEVKDEIEHYSPFLLSSSTREAQVKRCRYGTVNSINSTLSPNRS